MTLLIADSGSTKTNWILMVDGVKIESFNTLGVNPYINSLEDIRVVFDKVANEFSHIETFDNVYFYGAGCSSHALVDKVKEAFVSSNLQILHLEISHDLMAAARALFFKDEGIACILGTGSNSALYNGSVIIQNIPSLGYVLGDEGGGLDIGKQLLVSIFKKTAPKEIIDSFFDNYDLDINKLLAKVHFEDRPNKYIASFSLFVKDNIHHAFCQSIVESTFERFIQLNVRQYQNFRSLPISFVGSVAVGYSDIMRGVLENNQLNCGHFIKDPMGQLVSYHLANLP